ncbi:tetratricopeptide repeat protein [Phaeobacter sp. B1627]|uniref:tetratricopeptide repeat protein n=1 Tax=Phaeobacter sp. B1627 TaxID=2583809 RepID=UPI0011199AA2|nr:tetratricopeptide repeat protein [Phaeobacter sp. B1627]TNJ47430.1 hypothetical protein FGE21_02335 [Phaeobacter sp. B1627]
MKRLGICAIFLLGLSVLLDGLSPLGRIALALGRPTLAVGLFSDPAWRGVAQYRAGHMDAAIDSFAESAQTYNLGNAYVQKGQYAAALESYDRAIADWIPHAQENFDAVAAFYAGLQVDPDALALFEKRQGDTSTEAETGRGNARAAGTGDAVTNTNTMLGLAEMESHGNQGVRRVFDDLFMRADDRWLAQLPDVPGSYLKARILAEHKRRKKLGLSPPVAEDPM